MSIMTGLQLPQKILVFPNIIFPKSTIKLILMVRPAKNLKKALKTNTESKSLHPILRMKINTNPKSQLRLSNLPNQYQINIILPSIPTILLP